MRNFTGDQKLQNLFDTLAGATVPGKSAGSLVSMARKTPDCVEDSFAGRGCGG